MIEKKDLSKRISEEENIPLGTARRYVTEIKKETRQEEAKPEKANLPVTETEKKRAAELMKEIGAIEKQVESLEAELKNLENSKKAW